MAYENSSAAVAMNSYRESTAPKLPKENTKEQKRKAGVLPLPQDALLRIRKRKHNRFHLFVGGVVVAIVAVLVASILMGQVELNELNREIIETRTELSNQQSEETQLNMAIKSNMSTSEIEKYAKNTLGMSKAENAGKEYIKLSDGDKAEISEDANLNFIQKVIRAIAGLWS